EAMADVAGDAVVVALGLVQGGAVGRSAASVQPARRGMAAEAHLARLLDVLIGDGQAGVENGVARGLSHHASRPAAIRFHGQVVVAVTVPADRGIRDGLLESQGLRARLQEVLGRRRQREPRGSEAHDRRRGGAGTQEHRNEGCDGPETTEYPYYS